MALFLTQNLFVASGIDYLIHLTRPSHHRYIIRICKQNTPKRHPCWCQSKACDVYNEECLRFVASGRNRTRRAALEH